MLVTFQDGVGDTNASLLMRVARADGVLLKPERPAVAIDALWLGDIFDSGPLRSRTGEVSATFTEISGFRWHFVLGEELAFLLTCMLPLARAQSVWVSTV